MDKYDAQENIKHLTELLGEKLDPTKREIGGSPLRTGFFVPEVYVS
jgi:hypothetical protein